MSSPPSIASTGKSSMKRWPLRELRPKMLRELRVLRLATVAPRRLACTDAARRVRAKPKPHVTAERLGEQLEVAMALRQRTLDAVEAAQDKRRIVRGVRRA